jgi:metallo-beta-lactamase family protein
MEGTYGARLHGSSGDTRELLRNTVAEVCQHGGKLLIPAFAVGRTQEIVYSLNRLWEDEALPSIDVFVDSPLAVNATEVFRAHPECYDEEYLEMLVTDSDNDPLCFDRLKYVRSTDGSRALNDLDGPAVIISASGMCEGGRILHHLRHHAVDPRSIVLFVSFQAEHTLGRRIQEGRSPVSIYGEEYEMRASIRKAEGYSAHADSAGLLGWASRVQAEGDVQSIFLVHGEDEGLSALAQRFEVDGAADVQIPERGQLFEL